MDLLTVNGLRKRYKSFELKDISFSIPEGYIMGYVGQNGAGKTTTLNAICHLIKPDEGEFVLDGITFEKDPVRYRESIGYVGDSSYFPSGLTAKSLRTIMKDFYPTFDPVRYDEYCRKWKLPEKEMLKTYSRGMKVKLMFASVLARQTKLLILDEATNGLDPMVRKEILELLQEYIEDGKHSVLFSTHIMEDLEDIADYIFFIDNGEKIFCEAKDELLEEYLLVRGGQEDLTPSLARQLIGIEKNAYGFEGLYKTDGEMILPAALTTEKPSIDKIIVHMLEDRR
ncbi:MAG: ABC transporter ATP-binding protein [Lachnospiraceae bacterium]|nr:ABC transporter ATP-binding protein [Lachnospiraceae bacterium]